MTGYIKCSCVRGRHSKALWVGKIQQFSLTEPWGGSVSLTSRQEDTVLLQTLWGQGVGGSRWPGSSQCSCPAFCLCAPVKPLWPRNFRPWNSFCSMAWEIDSHSWEGAESDPAVLCLCSGLITGLHQYLVPASPEPPGLAGGLAFFLFCA